MNGGNISIPSRVEGAITGDVPHSTIKNSFYSWKDRNRSISAVLGRSHPISIVNKFKSSVSLMRIEFAATNVLRLIPSA